PQLARLARPRRQRFCEIDRVAHQSVVNDAAQRVLRKSCRRRIDRRQSLGKRRSWRDNVEARMDHLRTVATFAYFTEGPHPLARRQSLALARIEVKEPQHELGIAVFEQTHELAAPAVLHLCIDDSAFNLP